MALVSSSATKAATVPFDLLSLTYGVCRNFLDIMPLKDLHVLREGSDAVKSLSSFRGQIVEDLKVLTDTVGDKYFGPRPRFATPNTRYSEIITQQFNTTPLELLDVYMGPEMIPEVLLSKIDGQYYDTLWIAGTYHWKAVVSFLHTGVEYVNMHGHVELPAEAIEEFFRILFFYKVKNVDILNKKNDPSWLFTVEKIFNNNIGVTVEVVNHVRSEIVVSNRDTKIRIIENCDLIFSDDIH